MRWALDAKARADVVPVAAGPGNSMAVNRPARPTIGMSAPAPVITIDEAG
jgi:hypothetical protein